MHRLRRTATAQSQPTISPLSEEEDGNIDYRHRMLMNVIAVVVVSVLISAGVWIADTIAAMQKVQDCALQGRQNCAPIEVPVKKK